jgi:hypothetical protein
MQRRLCWRVSKLHPMYKKKKKKKKMLQPNLTVGHNSNKAVKIKYQKVTSGCLPAATLPSDESLLK